MSLEGYLDYQRREYCHDIACPVQTIMDGEQEGSEACERLRGICRSDCIHSTYEFHHWLIDKGYLLVRPQ
ncbi:MAG: hypothetical protein FVQ81_14255 [Candidatus Glassbacteria bacterium]|nr:hypothetical protein [Candidatus Glassbacteria bacterium]